MQVKITKISRKERETKYGTKTAVSIKTDAVSFKDKWLGGWEDDVNRDWKEGDTVDISVEKNGEYLNFKAIPVYEDSPIDVPYNEVQRPTTIVEPKKVITNVQPPKTQQSEDKTAEGKVRHGVACEFIRLGKKLDGTTVREIKMWTDFIMDGKLVTPEEKEIDEFMEEYNEDY